jgi:FkbM family methyltransferase
MTYKCQVRILDPTPRAIAHFQLLSGAVDASKPFLINGIPGNTYNIDKYTFSRIRFIPVGIAGANETMRFYYPKNEEHVSCSTVNLQKTDRWFEARCFQLSSIMRDQNDQKIDLLKMDIEGGEYAVISDLVSSGPLPNILLIEFDEAHSPMDDRAIERIALHISMLEKVGMKCIAIDGANLSFIRD